MRQWIFIAVTVLTTCATSSAIAVEWIKGRVTNVRDVDTIEVNGLAVRFDGIDGPELDTRVGKAGKAWLQKLVLRKPVRCSLTGEKTHDRWVGTCYLPSGEDIGALAISAGFARDCPRYSNGRYKRFENANSRKLRRSSYCR